MQKKEIKNQKRQPFFAQFLTNQGNKDNAKYPPTMKYPSDSDEYDDWGY